MSFRTCYIGQSVRTKDAGEDIGAAMAFKKLADFKVYTSSLIALAAD
jgi:hypothetical protein